MDQIDRLLTKVRTRTGGFMPVVVYRRLYASAASLGGATIGAYHAPIRADVPAREYGLVRSFARWAMARAPWIRRALGR